LNDFVTSDHKPLFVKFNLSRNLVQEVSSNDCDVQNNMLVDWTQVDEYSRQAFENTVDKLLHEVQIPTILLHESLNDNVSLDSTDAIGRYYNDVMSCVRQAGKECLPSKCYNVYNEHIIPGWNEIVSGKHQLARDAFHTWVVTGKPRQGPAFLTMKYTRAQFKLALRYCKQHGGMLRADFMLTA
jgi:hypothetical protein